MAARSIRGGLSALAIVTVAGLGTVGPLGSTALGSSSSLVFALLLLGVAPALAWAPWSGKGAGTWLERGGRALAFGWVHALLVLTVVGRAGLGLRAGWIVFAASVVGVGLLARAMAPPRRAPGRSDGGRSPLVLALVVLALALVAFVAARPQAPSLESDGPAHLGAVHDALSQGRWFPADRSFPDAPEGQDPRFGLLHGVYAALARISGASPAAVFRAAAVLFAALWLWGHAWWFERWGVRGSVAVPLALVFTLGGAGGRGFGTHLASYPGNAALALAALGFVLVWSAVEGRGGRASLVGVAVWILSAAIHPFGWWLSVTALAMMTLFLWPGGSGRALRALGLAALAGLGGLVVLLPLLLDRGESQAGLHQALTDVVMLGGNRFVVDPLSLARWSGVHSLWALPLALLAGRRWWKPASHRGALALAAAPWVLSLNPLFTPWLWGAVSYLLVRTGRLVHTPWWWAQLVVHGWREAADARRSWWTRIRVAVVGLIAAWLLVVEVGTALRSIAPPRVETHAERFEEMASALTEAEAIRPLTDPRVAYAIRSLEGGPFPIYPLAHASPRDRALPERLEAYRSLEAARIDARTWFDTLQRFDASHVLVDLDPERTHARAEYGFVPSAERARLLAARLHASGATEVSRGDSWRLYSLSGLHVALADTNFAGAARDSNASTPRASPWVEAAGLGVYAVELSATDTVPGEEIVARVWVQAYPDHFDWAQVFLRFEGPMPDAPAWARSFAKPYRKLVLERSGRSHARFGRGWVPFGGCWGPGPWEGPRVEEVRIRVPEHIAPGEYSVQVSVQPLAWRTRRPWQDYLREEDRFSGPEVARIRVLSRSR